MVCVAVRPRRGVGHLAVFAVAVVAKLISAVATVVWPVATRHRELRFVLLGLHRGALVVGPVVPLVGELALELKGLGLEIGDLGLEFVALGPEPGLEISDLGLEFVVLVAALVVRPGRLALLLADEQVVYRVPEVVEGAPVIADDDAPGDKGRSPPRASSSSDCRCPPSLLQLPSRVSNFHLYVDQGSRLRRLTRADASHPRRVHYQNTRKNQFR